MDTYTTPALPKPLRDALDRLGRHERVLGALLIGSLPVGTFTPASDYDLVVVVNGLEPLWYVGVTELGGRFADSIIVAGHALAQIQALDAPVPHDHVLAPVLRWLHDGVSVLDRAGLRAAQEYARALNLLALPGSESAYSAWFGLNYNLAVLRRLLQSDDPWYLAVADVRMAVYGHADLWFGYFAIRELPWPGDKAAMRVLEAQDPGYLVLFQQFIAESRRTEKARRYAELAALAAAPLGGLWPLGWTGENLARPPLRVAELLGKPGAAAYTFIADPADRVFAALAEAAGAALVTNDAHLLDQRHALRAPVLTPRAYWEAWQTGGHVGDGASRAPRRDLDDD